MWLEITNVLEFFVGTTEELNLLIIQRVCWCQKWHYVSSIYTFTTPHKSMKTFSIISLTTVIYFLHVFFSSSIQTVLHLHGWNWTVSVVIWNVTILSFVSFTTCLLLFILNKFLFCVFIFILSAFSFIMIHIRPGCSGHVKQQSNECIQPSVNVFSHGSNPNALQNVCDKCHLCFS